MTKPFTPEFTDRAGALAFIAAGRKGGNERPTKDSWNTFVRKTSADDVVMYLHGAPIAWWQRDATTLRETVTFQTLATMLEFTHRKRLNDYVLNPHDLKLEADGAVVGPFTEVTGNGGVPVPITGRMGSVDFGMDVEIDVATRTVSGLKPYHGAPIAKADMRRAIDKWVDAAIQTISQVSVNDSYSQASCMQCSPVKRRGSVSDYTGDTEHLFAHVFGLQVNASLFTFLDGGNASLVGYVNTGSDTFQVGPVTDPELQKQLRNRLTRTMHKLLVR